MTDWGLDDFMLKTMDKIGTHNFNKLDEEINLRRFHDTQRLEERKQLRREEIEDMDNKERVRVRIKTELQRARDRAAFMDKWIEEGRESWQVNEDKRVEREKVRLDYWAQTLKQQGAFRFYLHNPPLRLASLAAASLAAAPARVRDCRRCQEGRHQGEQ